MAFVHFEKPPALGTTARYKEQVFVLDSVSEYFSKKTGRDSWVLSWHTNCVQCGGRYVAKTGLHTNYPTRRCRACIDGAPDIFA